MMDNLGIANAFVLRAVNEAGYDNEKNPRQFWRYSYNVPFVVVDTHVASPDMLLCLGFSHWSEFLQRVRIARNAERYTS